MTTLILDEFAEARVLAERRANGLDRFDEVWDGVYVMSPIADNEHQFMGGKLVVALDAVCSKFGGRAFPGCNVSDREVDWTENYRVPDAAVYFPTNPAQDKGSHWFGGPDFAVEVCSKKDRTWDKLDFYAGVQTRELLIIDRNPWKLSLLRLVDRQLVIVGTSTLETPTEMLSEVMPAVFRLLPRAGQKPAIEVRHLTDGRVWVVDPT